jgi:Ca2+-binding RTX toxin-like protein
MTVLQALQVYSAGPAVFSSQITGIEIAIAPGGNTVLYAGSGWGGGLQAWSVQGNGALSLLDQTAYTQTVAPFAGMAMVPVEAGATMRLFGVTSQTDAILSQPLRGDGGFLGPLATVMAGHQAPDGPGPVAAADNRLFAAQAEGGIAAYEIAGNGGLGYRGETGDGGPVSGLAALERGGQTVVIASHATDHSVTSHLVTPTGGLVRIDAIGAAQGLGLGLPGPVAIAETGGRHYALVGASLSGSVSVLEITGNGTLVARDHVLDTLASRFGQITSLETVTHDGSVFVLAGGGDDGITLMSLLPGGRLIHLDSLADGLSTSLQNVTAIGATALNGRLAIYATSETEPGLTRLNVDLGSFGDAVLGNGTDEQLFGSGQDDILWGRGGDDTLTGRGGDDIFVFDRPVANVRITDFDPARDRLDLSMLPMFHGPAQLDAMGAPNGITLGYNNTFTLHLNRTGGGTIDLGEITFETALSHLPTGNGGGVPQAPAPAASLIGSRYADALSGNSGHDLIRGNAGRDTLMGHDGNDTILAGQSDDRVIGGAGHDSLNGQTGDDTLLGGAGNDTILGVFGEDLILGGMGDDEINGQTGEDTIHGGAGNDSIRGSYFDDTLYGDGGNDTLDGGALDDLVHGGTGHDEINGVTGNDRLFGEQGNDTLRAGAGIDRLEGGTGDDLLAGGDHSDRLYGDDGDDTLQGQDGLDRLEGGFGNDLLIGGMHADIFVFALGGGQDTINDFANNQDVIALDTELWTGGMTRQQLIATNAQVAGGSTLLDFGDGDTLLIRGVGTPQLLVDDIAFI